MKTTETILIPPVAIDRLVRRCVTHHFACDCREARFRELLEDTIRAHSTPDNGNYNECDKDPCAWCKDAKALIYHGHPDGVLYSTNARAMPPGAIETHLK